MADDLASLLATGVPRGLIGVGIDPDTLSPETRVATFYGAFSTCAFDTKSGGLKVTFLVPAEHQLLALGVRDMARSRLDQLRAQEIRDRIEHDHARRQVQRAMKQWTGSDGPEDA